MKRLLCTIALASVAASFSFTSHAVAGDRTAEAIIADIEGVKYPAVDPSKRDDDAYIRQYIEERSKADKARAEFILELYKAHPTHDKIMTFMPQRWMILMNDEASQKAVAQEMDEVIAADPNGKLAGEAKYLRAQNGVQKAIWSEKPDTAAASKAIEDFIKAAPSDERAARLLGMLADAYEDGSAEQKATYERIQKDYPKSGVAKFAAGKVRQANGVGKPFELTFHNAITDETVDMKDLHGKVVVVDFWATWCGPCVGEMPHMKELYAKFHDKGVEFIGVSLDQPEEKGGLDKLKKFVAEKEIAWPQYYQGHGWDSEFSTSWGINAIPCLFIVDKQGNLRSTQARGKLEELIPKLLAE